MSEQNVDSGKGEKVESQSGGSTETELDEQVWASAGGCGPAIDPAEAWTRMGDTCCGNEGCEPEAS